MKAVCSFLAHDDNVTNKPKNISDEF